MSAVQSTTKTSKRFTVKASRVIEVLGLEAGDEIVAAEWGYDPARGEVALIFHVENAS